MIDYLKIYVKDQDVIQSLLNNPHLEWRQNIEGLSHIEKEAKEGIIKASTTKVYKGAVFCFTELTRTEKKTEYHLVIYLKPHYLFNDNKHNANDFPIAECVRMLKGFSVDLQIENTADRLLIQNIEYGVNVLSPIKVEDLVTFFAYHKRNEFLTDTGLKFSKKSSGTGKGGTASKYQIIKVYAKGIQFPKYADHNLLRFEIKSQESRKIKSLGIKSIADLLQPENYQSLSNDLLSRFDEVLILDSSVNMAKLSHRNRLKLIERLNTHYWYQQLQMSRNTFQTSKNAYLKLLDKTGCNIHTDLKNIFTSKLDELFYCASAETLQETENCASADIYIIRECTLSSSTFSRHCIISGKEFLGQQAGDYLFSEVEQAAIKRMPENEAQETVKAIIEEYTVALLKDHLGNNDLIPQQKYLAGRDIEKVIQITMDEVKETFNPYFIKWSLQPSCTERNYFAVPGAQVMEWQASDFLYRFENTFYLSQENGQETE